MALSNKDKHLLQEILLLEGKCMESNRCMECPFRAMCLPDFLNPIPPTTAQRDRMAGDILINDALLDEEIVFSDYKWNKK